MRRIQVAVKGDHAAVQKAVIVLGSQDFIAEVCNVTEFSSCDLHPLKLVYVSLPQTTALTDYAIGVENLSAKARS